MVKHGRAEGEGLVKPLGVTSFLQVVRPAPAQDAIWDAVEEAIAAGMTVEQFRREAQEAWQYQQKEQARADAKEWERQ